MLSRKKDGLIYLYKVAHSFNEGGKNYRKDAEEFHSNWFLWITEQMLRWWLIMLASMWFRSCVWWLAN